MSATNLIHPLPASIRSTLGLWTFGSDGRVLERFGFDDELEDFGSIATTLEASGRQHASRESLHGTKLVVTYPASQGGEWAEFFEFLLASELDRRQLETDLESMSASSLALLEEVTMVGDVMTELSTGETDEGVVQLGLQSIVVGASAERALYFRYEPSRDAFEFVVQVVFDEANRRGKVAPYVGEAVVEREGVVGRAADAGGAVLLDSVVGQDLPDGSPESLAAREVLAVSVTHGQDQHARLLGVMLLFDKRATSYSNVTAFGSGESKMASGLASMLAAVLGARKTAELGKELKMATAIQQQILPDRPAVVSGYDLAGRCETSGAVGGDYFDFLPMPDGRTMCVVADVSGHNLASGMVMVSARSALRLLASKHSDAQQIFDDLAAAIFTDLNRTERFITAAGVVLDESSGAVDLVNAGHNDTMVFRNATGEVERIPSEDTILGFLPGVSYERTQVELAPGDVLVLYTDGVTEAVDENGEMFEEERLADILAGCASGTAQEILDSIYGAVEDFADEAAGSDDITAVVVKHRGKAEER